MAAGGGVIQDLEARLARYPSERYPVQHATTQFHLGLALLQEDRLDDACAALISAARLFDPRRLPAEHAKAANALGAALRTAHRLEEAAAAFGRAAEMFEAATLPLEQGAATFNIGLVQRECGDLRAAAGSLERARELLDERAVPGQASAAARELGGVLLELGQLEPAADALREAMRLAEAVGERPAVAAAANALGLAELAGGSGSAAIDAFRAALAASPRSIRPADYAMVKANLALGYEATGDYPRARLSARQALAVAAAPEPVAAQARALLERLSDPAGDLLRVLTEEARPRWAAVVRDDLPRWLALTDPERRTEAGAWIDGQLARPDDGADLASALVGGILELPAEDAEAVIGSILDALSEREQEPGARFRSEISRAMARFHVPQWMRLRDTFNRLAAERGQEPEWA